MPEPTGDAWTQIRYDYEHTNRPIEDICAEHGISSGTLRDRMRRWRWTRRCAPIPREGPPATARIKPAPQQDIDVRRTLPLGPRVHGEERAEPPQQTVAAFEVAPADGDPASIAPRLQGAVARVLPAIEAIIARLAAGPLPPREIEQTARALGTLTRTLRELNALLAQHPARAASDYDDMPEDMDAFREALARRIRAFVESRRGEDEESAAAESGGEAPAER